MDRLRVAIVGAGRRAHRVYAPLVVMMKDDLELVAVSSRRLESATALGSKHGVPAFDDLNQLVEAARPDLCIVTVRNAANGPTGRQVAELGLPMLQETPIANDLSDADAILAPCPKSGRPVEVAEQYYRRPMERIKAQVL